MKLARRTLLRRTLQGRRRIWIAGRGRWLVAVLLPLAAGLVIVSTPTGEVIPGFLLLYAVIGATVIGGRAPGMVAAAVATASLATAFVVQEPGRTDASSRWVWAVVFFGLTVAAVAWVDNLLGDAARRATALLDPLVEAAPVGIALFDRDLRFVRANTSLAALTGRSAAEHLGRALDDVLPDVPRELVARLRTVLTSGATVRHELLPITTTSGAARHFAVDAFPVRMSGGADGYVTGVGAVITDVTERNRLEQLEREAEQLQATARVTHRLLESQRIAQLAGFEVSLTGRRYIWSQELCALMGRDEPPASDEEVAAHVHPDDLDRMYAVQTRAVLTGAPYTTETRMIRADGSVRDMLIHGEAVRADDDPEADVVGLWGVIQDITDAKAAEGELEATQGELVAAQRDVAEAREEIAAERLLLELFQRAMLPAELPDVPGGAVKAEYFAVADRIDVGGDWYDAFPLPDGRIALSIGDVVGHDQQAAATMGQVRAVNRGYMLEHPDPGAVLSRLNRLMLVAYPSGTLVSAIVCLYDPGTGRLDWANAGHPFPLLAVSEAEAAAEVSVLKSADPILGASVGRAYATHTLTMPGNSTLLCYTDGLIERRSVDLDLGQERLVELLSRIVAGPGVVPAQTVIAQVTAGMTAGESLEDDVCVLALQRHADID
ncbi:SpoIIE family protein phosphatase [Cryptosporangium sp. NPDC048952]|uniref:SpoIIE family protein phosphatase n=1 Tax=Cryptosporangium sp. NPDC048952 TaxID=3363961 RepID=UPI0037198405